MGLGWVRQPRGGTGVRPTAEALRGEDPASPAGVGTATGPARALRGRVRAERRDPGSFVGEGPERPSGGVVRVLVRWLPRVRQRPMSAPWVRSSAAVRATRQRDPQCPWCVPWLEPVADRAPVNAHDSPSGIARVTRLRLRPPWLRYHLPCWDKSRANEFRTPRKQHFRRSEVMRVRWARGQQLGHLRGQHRALGVEGLRAGILGRQCFVPLLR